MEEQTNMVSDYFQGFTAEEISKYQKYEAEYACRLTAKYFSNKDMYGGDIHDLRVDVGDDTIKSSRSLPIRSYAEPAQSFEDPAKVTASCSETPSEEIRHPNASNGDIAPLKKNS